MPTGPQAPQALAKRTEREQEERRGEKGRQGKEEKTTGSKLMPLDLSQTEQRTHTCSAAAAGQDRVPPVETGPGQGRAGQGTAVGSGGCSSLNALDLTSQGFFYIPACTSVSLGFSM